MKCAAAHVETSGTNVGVTVAAIQGEEFVPALPSPVIALQDPAFHTAGVRVWVKRDDLIHPLISGNKWRKLRLNLTAAKQAGHRTLLTFGGAYSNHIHAVASAGKIFGFDTIGVIRGEPGNELNPILAHAVACGMHLHYLDRQTYRRKNEADVIARLQSQYGACYCIPEGGSNAAGVAGCRDIVTELDAQRHGHYDAVVCACGTGATLAGIAAALGPNKKAVGISVLRGHSGLDADVDGWIHEQHSSRSDTWRIHHHFHHGGYAKQSPQLLAFVQTFREQHGIPIEPVYTGKMFYALYELIKAGMFARGSTVVAVHTGGVHGAEA